MESKIWICRLLSVGTNGMLTFCVSSLNPVIECREQGASTQCTENNTSTVRSLTASDPSEGWVRDLLFRGGTWMATQWDLQMTWVWLPLNFRTLWSSDSSNDNSSGPLQRFTGYGLKVAQNYSWHKASAVFAVVNVAMVATWQHMGAMALVCLSSG
jgi:hypothetical protein